MRLINTHTLTLEVHNVQWNGAEYVPRYAILSHTWHEDEVTFEDLAENKTFKPVAHSRRGWDKIERSCEKARLEGLDYVWVDTCCIDKSSSAELSEAINSMFQWYRKAAVCFAFLADAAPPPPSPASDTAMSKLFSRCRWFTRGWTLQELVAPREMQFYDASWELLGTKASLVGPLAEITRIPALALAEASLDQFTVAQKMSWAARRQTTRDEDLSYCLLGTFNISMPLLYGEGRERAFLRLQEEIMRRCDDDSVFAWRVEKDGPDHARGGLLATSPACFEGCEGVLAMPADPFADFLNLPLQLSPVVVTNRGWKVHRRTYPEGFWLRMPLRCWDVKRQPGPGKSVVSITLTEHGMHDTNQYTRIDRTTIPVADLHHSRRCEEREFYLIPSQQPGHDLDARFLCSSRDIWIRSLPDGCSLFRLEASDSGVTMSDKTRLCQGIGEDNWVAIVLRSTAAGAAAATLGTSRRKAPPSPMDFYVALFVWFGMLSERPVYLLESGPDPDVMIREGHNRLLRATYPYALATTGGGSSGGDMRPECLGPDGTVWHALLDTDDNRARGPGNGTSGAEGSKRYVADIFSMGNNSTGGKMWDTSPVLVQGSQGNAGDVGDAGDAGNGGDAWSALGIQIESGLDGNEGEIDSDGFGE